MAPQRRQLNSNQLEQSIAKYCCLLGRGSLVLSHICYMNKQRASALSPPKKSTLVSVQLGWQRNIFHSRSPTARCWQSQWKYTRKSPTRIQRRPHLCWISHKLGERRRRSDRWTDLLISSQFIYNSSSNICCPSSHWRKSCHVDCHGHHYPGTIQYHTWRSRSVWRRWRRSAWRKRRRPTRRRRRRPAWRRKCQSSRSGRRETHGRITHHIWRRSLKSWELSPRVLHLPPH